MGDKFYVNDPSVVLTLEHAVFYVSLHKLKERNWAFFEHWKKCSQGTIEQ